MKAWCDSENTIKTFDFYTKMLFIDFFILTSLVHCVRSETDKIGNKSEVACKVPTDNTALD